MERLYRKTAAFAVFSQDAAKGRLSHAYILRFCDSRNARAVAKLFACAVFGDIPGVRGESLPDLKIYPADGKKYTAGGISEIISDSALKPVGGDKKLYILLNFDSATALVQNKLLKTLEEPQEGVHFLLCASSLAPVLDTVKSRARLLEIPPFSAAEISEVLRRENADERLAEAAAESCNGDLGEAQNMVSGDWFKEVVAAAEEICSANSPADILKLSQKYGDITYKRELLSEMQRLYFSALSGKGKAAGIWQKPALLYALEKITSANADVTFNAYFAALLYDFMLGMQKENEKWLKLRA